MKRRPFIALLAAASLLFTPLAANAATTAAKGPVPATISNGDKVRLTDYVVPGKTTIFDFSSEYCPTCKALAPDVKKLHATRDDIVVVFVNINRPGFKGIDWDSPVSKQYDLPSTPQFKVFGPDGRLQAEGKPAYKLVTGWFK